MIGIEHIKLSWFDKLSTSFLLPKTFSFICSFSEYELFTGLSFSSGGPFTKIETLHDGGSDAKVLFGSVNSRSSLGTTGIDFIECEAVA
jgi:hypothetical protein